MNNHVHIFFDLDDTMLKTQEGYNRVNEMVAASIVEMTGMPLDVERVLKKGIEIDIDASLKVGLSKERFPSSWVKTYRYFMILAGKEPSSVEERRIADLANKVYRDRFAVYERVHETLKVIQKMGMPMYILTAGNHEVQNQRVDDAEIRDYFSDVLVVNEKTPDVMKEIVGERSPAVMIGNSLRSDIYPALQNGMTAIHLERNTWDYDQYEVDTTHQNYHVIREFDELPNLLASILPNEPDKEAV